LEAQLFARTTRKVVLTEAGARLLPLAREVLSAAERLRSAGSLPGRPSPYELLVGTRYELGLSWLCPLLGRLARAHPERTIHLSNGDSPDLLWRLERGDLDAIVGSMRLTSPRLAYASLHAEEYTFVARTRCLRRRDDARRLTLLDVTPDLPLFRYVVDALAEAEPWPFARIEYLGGIGNIRRRLLEGGERVALLPSYFVRSDVRAGRLVRLLPQVTPRSDSFRLVWRADHPRRGELLLLAEELRQHPLV
jgi:DNA-binding transcriptional LysR family regulator